MGERCSSSLTRAASWGIRSLVAGDAAKRKVACVGRMHELRIWGRRRRRVPRRTYSRGTREPDQARWQRSESRVHAGSLSLSVMPPSLLCWPPCSWQERDRRAIEFPQQCFRLTAPPTARVGIGWLDSDDGTGGPQRAKATWTLRWPRYFTFVAQRRLCCRLSDAVEVIALALCLSPSTGRPL